MHKCCIWKNAHNRLPKLTYASVLHSDFKSLFCKIHTGSKKFFSKLCFTFSQPKLQNKYAHLVPQWLMYAWLDSLQMQRLKVAWNESSFEQKECRWFWNYNIKLVIPLKNTNLFSELDVEVLDDDNVWEFDMRETNFWMVLRDGALILELRLLWYFWNKLST